MTLLVTILSFLFVIALLITVHEWGHYRMATLVGVRVLRFAVGFGKPLFKWTPKRQPLLDGKPQTTEFVIALLPFGGYVKMQDEREVLEVGQAPIDAQTQHQSFNRKPLWARSAVVFAGPLANFVLALLLFSIVNWVGMQMPQARITEVVQGGAAAMAQLQVGDVVLAVDGRKMTDSFQLRELIRRSDQNRAQQWQIERLGAVQTLVVTPRAVDEQSESMGKLKIGRVGAMIGAPTAMVDVRYGLVDGVVVAAEKTWDLSALTLKTLGKMIVGEASLKNLTGPVTVAEYSGKTVLMGLTTYLLFLGLVSVSLGVLNLLPLPMLDGGHLMYYLWELLTGKAVSEWWLDALQRLGFVFLMLLMALALYNDLIRVFGLTSWIN
jgi:membrane-associated protease RseP (regulator of RpoE activity)